MDVTSFKPESTSGAASNQPEGDSVTGAAFNRTAVATVPESSLPTNCEGIQRKFPAVSIRQSRIRPEQPIIHNAKSVTGALGLFGFKSSDKLLGEGGYGKVGLWSDKEQNTIAVKIIFPHLYRNPNAVGLEKGEVCALDLPPNPHLVEVKGVLVKEKQNENYALITDKAMLTRTIKRDYYMVAVISELALGDELWGYLDRTDVNRTNQFVVRLGCDMTDALSHLHQQGMVYRDLKQENIVYDSNANKSMLLDFGYLKEIRKGRTKTPDGTRIYIAPEVWGAKEPVSEGYGYSCDAWTLGCLLLECITDKLIPSYSSTHNDFRRSTDRVCELFFAQRTQNFSKLSDEDKINIIQKHKCSKFKEDVDLELLTITAELLRHDVTRRLSIEDAKDRLSKLLNNEVLEPHHE